MLEVPRRGSPSSGWGPVQPGALRVPGKRHVRDGVGPQEGRLDPFVEGGESLVKPPGGVDSRLTGRPTHCGRVHRTGVRRPARSLGCLEPGSRVSPNTAENQVDNMQGQE